MKYIRTSVGHYPTRFVALVSLAALLACGGGSTTGDWESVEEYRAEMTLTFDQTGDLFGTMAEAAASWEDDYLTDGGYQEVLYTAIRALDSHRDFFEGKAPPPVFADVQSISIEMWDTQIESWEVTIQALGPPRQEYSVYERSLDLQDQVYEDAQDLGIALNIAVTEVDGT